VERAWSPGREKDTKTHDHRIADMSRNLTGILREHLTWLKAEAVRRGWGQPQWLFPSVVGRPMDKTKVGRVFRRVLRGAGLAAFRVYDLRQRRCWPIWNQKWTKRAFRPTRCFASA
jgi:hypothetical protein